MWWIGLDLVLLRSKMTWFYDRNRNYLRFCVGSSNSTLHRRGDRKLRNFSDGVEMNLVLKCEIEVNFVLVSGSKLTCFLCGDHH